MLLKAPRTILKDMTSHVHTYSIWAAVACQACYASLIDMCMLASAEVLQTGFGLHGLGP